MSMKYKQDDICEMITIFQADTAPTDRYSSFDFCYHHFHPSTSRNNKDDIEKSCLAIGFYLASWGMLRGSSFLLNKSAKYYEKLVIYLSGLNAGVWEIDVDNYNSENIDLICSIYKEIKELIIENGNQHLTLVTKIMLGVFGFIPAFDNYFSESFRGIFNGECGFRSVNKKSLNCIRIFYENNKEEIDNYSKAIKITEFSGGNKSTLNYKKAKIIDMYGFTKGLPQK